MIFIISIIKIISNNGNLLESFFIFHDFSFSKLKENEGKLKENFRNNKVRFFFKFFSLFFPLCFSNQKSKISLFFVSKELSFDVFESKNQRIKNNTTNQKNQTNKQAIK